MSENTFNDKSLISVIVVNWNTKELLQNCLSSLYEKNNSINFETYVIDNASNDGSAEMVEKNFAEVHLVLNNENIGFARANNQAIKLSNTKYILLLNSDTEFKTIESLRKIVLFLEEHSNIGIVGVRLVFPNGSLQAAGRDFISIWGLIKSQLLFSRSPVLMNFKALLNKKRQLRPYKTDFVDGAFFFIRRTVVNQIGLMNENYFMYGEDMEWCLRARKAGWEVAVLPEIEVIHHHGKSTVQNLPHVLKQNVINNCNIIKNLYGRGQAKMAYIIYMIGMLLRTILTYFQKRQKALSYLEAFRSCLKIRIG